ncbi:MAG TPA: type VI secretion system tube protein Hcp [Candidatus Dormibacteraeota bacterium]
MAFDAFLKLVPAAAAQPAPTGESQDAKHPGEIPISGYNLGITQHITQGSASAGAGAGKATFTDFSFTTPVSKASPLLFQACAAGARFSQAIVSLRKAGGASKGAGFDFLKITMNGVFVSGYSSGGAAGDESPHDDVHLSCAGMHFDYTPQRPDGSADTPVKGGWDITKNVPA